jgi:hypothetical protein
VAPAPFGSRYGAADSYEAIEAASLPDSVTRFLKGSECVEVIAEGEDTDPPLDWLADEPSIERIREAKWQRTIDRRICRWSFDWTPAQERNWK